MGSKSGYIEQLVLGLFALECLSAKKRIFDLAWARGPSSKSATSFYLQVSRTSKFELGSSRIIKFGVTRP